MPHLGTATRSLSVALLPLVALAGACDSAPTAALQRAPIPAVTTSPPATATPIVARVTVTYVSGPVDTTTWTLRVGDSVHLRATAYDSADNVLAQAAVFRTSNPQALTVDSNGVVTAAGAGEATISAVVGGVTGDFHAFIVQPVVDPTTPATPEAPATPSLPAPTPPAAPPSASSVAMSVVRFDGGSGAATVSAGVPLVPGALQPGQEGNVHLFVDGTELPAYVSGLWSRHPDGSLRAVLVQFRVASLGSGQPLAARLDIGAARSAEMTIAAPLVVAGAPVPGVPNGVPQAAALPTDPSYLIATELVGPSVSAAQTQALGGAFARYESDFAKYADKFWASEGADYLLADYYDRALIYYAMWVRTGNPTYWARAGQLAYDYRTRYIEANAYGTSPHWAQLEGLEKHYLLTGDDASRSAVVKAAYVLQLAYINSGYMTSAGGESRIVARVLHAQLLAWRLQPAGAPTETFRGHDMAAVKWGASIETAISKLVVWQQADGSYPSALVCGGQLNYMVGLLDDALIKTYDYYVPTTTSRAALQGTIQSLVQKATDYLWGTQWVASKSAFQYASVDCTAKGVGGTGAAPDLNNMMTAGFGWVYRRTGDARYLAAGEAVFAGGVTQAYLAGTKQFNENYTSSFRYFGYR